MMLILEIHRPLGDFEEDISHGWLDFMRELFNTIRRFEWS